MTKQIPKLCPFCGSTNLQAIFNNIDEDNNKPWPMLVATDYNGDLETYDYGVLEFECEQNHNFYITKEK